ncbi:MAG: hypothetical protein QXO86_01710 [Nitrososphaerota archaeon]
MRVVNLSEELPHKSFLPVSRRKLVITATVLAALSALLIILDPSQPLYDKTPRTTLLILTTSVVLLLLALAPSRSLVRSINVRETSEGLHLEIFFRRELSGFIEVGELTAAESVLNESIQTIYRLEPAFSMTFNKVVSVSTVIPRGKVTGLLAKKGEGADGLLRCPALKLSMAHGQEVFIAWIRPVNNRLKVEFDKPYLYLQGAQCSLSHGSRGGLNYLLSASDRKGGLFSSKVALKLLRVLSWDSRSMRHEQVLYEVRGGEVGSGYWQPHSYKGEDILVVFDKSRRVGELMSELKMREFVADPVPGVEYTLVLESKRNRLKKERDITSLAIRLPREEEYDEERA